MNTTTYGGVPVRNVDEAMAAPEGTLVLGEGPYRYELVTLAGDKSFGKALAGRYCVYVLNAPGGVRINGLSANSDEFVLGDAAALEIDGGGSPAMLLVASQQADAPGPEPMRVHPLAAAKRVEKPWGHEIWLTGDPSKVFAFKRILLKAGHKTSLQYHRFKRETNFILQGVAMLHYNPDADVPAERFQAREVARARLPGPCVADVFPGMVHRLEAIEDLLLYEVSTPELDDVIRLADDAGRDSGRIADEHLRAG